ncbi:hypothetical protein GW17_00059100, partial [Ensete ventricosum]
TMETPLDDGNANWVLRAYQTEETSALQPLSTPVVINLSYTVMHSLEGRLVEEPLRSLSGTSSTKRLTAKRSRSFSSASAPPMVMTSASPGDWRDNSLPSVMIQSRRLSTLATGSRCDGNKIGINFVYKQILADRHTQRNQV